MPFKINGPDSPTTYSYYKTRPNRISSAHQDCSSITTLLLSKKTKHNTKSVLRFLFSCCCCYCRCLGDRESVVHSPCFKILSDSDLDPACILSGLPSVAW